MQIVWHALGPFSLGVALQKRFPDHRPVVRVVGTRPGIGSRERERERKKTESNSGPGNASAKDRRISLPAACFNRIPALCAG
jgi:hypothetical protein